MMAASAVVSVWERGGRLHPIDRALLLLTLSPDGAGDAPASLCLGEREDRLLAVRAAWFGDRLPSYVTCPACGEGLEFELSVAALRDRSGPPDPADVVVSFAGGSARVRMPDSRDLAAAAALKTPDQARQLLLSRCVRSLTGARTLGDLTPPALQSLSDAIGQADPRSETLLELACVACSHAWVVAFEIGAYLWTEVEREAKRLLTEVHTLAKAYSWAEAEILAMPKSRRQFYLGLLGQ